MMGENNELNQVGQEVVRKRRVGNPAMTGDCITADQGTIANLMDQGLVLFNLPKIDLHDPEQVQERIDFYFNLVKRNGNRPTINGLGMSLNGMSRQVLWEIRTGNYKAGRTKTPFDLPSTVVDIIKRAYAYMEELWENYMQTGRINPVSGIFLGKNYYGYQDKQDVVITPKNPEGEYNAKDIADRYTLPEASDSDDSDSDS